MKNIQFFATALLLTIALFNSSKINAQWSQSNTAIYQTTLTKNVGIGITTPTEAKLQFAAEIGNKICLGAWGTERYGFGMNNYNLSAFVPANAGFSVRTNGYNGVEKFVVNPNGSTQIGSRLYPGATGTENGYSLVHFKNGTSTTGGILRTSIGNSDYGDAPLQVQSSRFDVNTAGTNRMTVTNSGNFLVYKQTFIGNGTNNGSIDLGFGPEGTGEGIGSKRTVGGNQYGLDFYTAGLNRISITQGGKVGIGISEPAKMPGNYRLYVADGIMTEKVKVALKNTGDWADYVFADDYKLRSLTEVEAFVKENKHLPGVPSAEEVQKTGIDMASMDAKLLEKIEELTLYLIGIQKENESLRKEVETLKNDKK